MRELERRIQELKQTAEVIMQIADPAVNTSNAELVTNGEWEGGKGQRWRVNCGKFPGLRKAGDQKEQTSQPISGKGAKGFLYLDCSSGTAARLR